MNSTRVLMCHAPIVMEEIAEERASDCRLSTEAMRKAASYVLSLNPKILVLISPHTPRFRSSFGVYIHEKLRGDFSPFGRPDLSYSFKGSGEKAKALCDYAKERGVPLEALPEKALDHGALVPLHFLLEAGWKGETLVFSLPAHDDPDASFEFGKVLREFLKEDDHALVASGDMSHRLIPEAPAGFHPRAKEFDRAFVKAIENQNVERLVHPEEILRDIAAEDVVSSCAVALGARKKGDSPLELLSYEGPFGVGYCMAKL